MRLLGELLVVGSVTGLLGLLVGLIARDNHWPTVATVIVCYLLGVMVGYVLTGVLRR